MACAKRELYTFLYEPGSFPKYVKMPARKNDTIITGKAATSPSSCPAVSAFVGFVTPTKKPNKNNIANQKSTLHPNPTINKTTVFLSVATP
jgi:hypothetical protein